MFCPQYADAQIYSNTANASKSIKYDSFDGNDMLFVFYQSHGTFKSGSLSVDSPDGSATFEWRKYDPSADAFSIIVDDFPSATSTTIADLDEGGYSVHIFDGGSLDTTFTAWVMLDNFIVGTEKDEHGMVKNSKSGCPEDNYLYLDGFVTADSFFYYDPVTHDLIRFQNDYTFEWTSDNSEIEIFNASRTLHPDQFNIVPLPVEDSYFILTATDSLGMTEVDSVMYDTKFTRAEFTVEYWDKLLEEYDPDLGEGWDLKKGSLDAPLTVRFINESKNGAEYTWVFLDTINEITQEGTKISLDTTELEYQAEFTYYNADEYYYPFLVSISDANCRDTFELEDGIRVVGSELETPNVFSAANEFSAPSVFTPNGDTNNDFWFFKHQSIKECKIRIINRYGKVVYKKNIEDIYAWQLDGGWNGNILNTDRPAPPGQYYYIIEALGYDNKAFKDPNVIERWKIERQQGGTNTQTPTNGNDPEQGSSSATNYTGWLYLFRDPGMGN